MDTVVAGSVPTSIEYITFANLVEAEEFIFNSVDSEYKSKLEQIIAILYIKRHKLFQQKRNEETGKPFAFFEEWLRSIEPELERHGAGKMSSIKKWLASYRVFCEQMSYSKEWLLDMGQHGKELLAAANLGPTDSELEYEDKPTPEGGRKLGMVAFQELSNEIFERVSRRDPSVPELDWKVADTRSRVREILGKPEPVSWVWDVMLAGEEVQVKEMTVLIGEESGYAAYKFFTREPIPLEHFERFAKGKINGLEV